MPLKSAILEWGTGVDVHGKNYTLAARRAVWDAIHHSSLTFLELFGDEAMEDMVVEATVAIPNPDEVNADMVLAALPHDKPSLKIVQGGLEIEGREGSGDFTIIANAAIIVKLNVG
ncbi:MAG: Lin0512 family protein [SAR202 cluster bacterium]|jgi:uncharacterized protein (TIGR02058 family)|nr:Lin0512 family protein [SAR202 cluster bacterium]MDP6512356.1 Lin0512 family protein [SAR202 cluster bacterium]MDP6716125.1 Lin0512 family protein [SAR202 cluster bacterium]